MREKEREIRIKLGSTSSIVAHVEAHGTSCFCMTSRWKHASHLSFGEVQLLRRLHSLPGVQVFVLVEDLFQFADLLGGELGAHAALRSVLLRLASLVRGGALGGGRFALVPGRVPADFRS